MACEQRTDVKIYNHTYEHENALKGRITPNMANTEIRGDKW